MAHEVGWYPLDLVPGFARARSQGSIYERLAEQHDARPDAGEHTDSADTAGTEHAALLGIDPDAPVLVFHRIATARGLRVEDVTSWYRADRYRIATTLEP